MKLSPSTIAANLSAAAAAEAEAAANSNSTSNVTSTNTGVTTATNANTSLNHTSTKPMNQSNTSSKLTPKDTQVIATILKEMGIVEYEPRVLPQLVEFAYRYASRVLDDAQLFSSYAKKKVIDTDDVSIAIQMQVDRSFVGPPSRDVLLEIARNKNNQPLPPIKSHNGMRLPADRYSLVAPNLRLISTENQTGQKAFKTGTSLLSNTSFVNSKLSLSTLNSNKTNSSQISTNSFLNNDVGTKRKLEP